MLDVTVVVCTHNPRPDYFARVLDGLRRQTLPQTQWELLVVDNASRHVLASRWDMSWHPNSRHLQESELGLVWARRRGIQQASGALIVFVDDDNVLDETYLAEAFKIHCQWPSLGVWGSGSIRGDFEKEPPESIPELRPWLALRELPHPRWGNVAWSDDAIPWGAGLCVRKEVALAYAEICERSGIQIVGRQGKSLLSADDREISLLCCSHGLGIGIFPELGLTHLIPEHRLSKEYFLRLVEGTYVSNFLLDYKWRQITPQPTFSFKTLATVLKTVLLCRGLDRDKRFAWVRALIKARKMIEHDLQANGHSTSRPCTPARAG